MWYMALFIGSQLSYNAGRHMNIPRAHPLEIGGCVFRYTSSKNWERTILR